MLFASWTATVVEARSAIPPAPAGSATVRDFSWRRIVALFEVPTALEDTPSADLLRVSMWMEHQFGARQS